MSEIVVSCYSDPGVKSGQHTNGPANIFIREDDTCPWYVVLDRMPLSKVRTMIAKIGIYDFQRLYCAKLES